MLPKLRTIQKDTFREVSSAPHALSITTFCHPSFPSPSADNQSCFLIYPSCVSICMQGQICICFLISNSFLHKGQFTYTFALIFPFNNISQKSLHCVDVPQCTRPSSYTQALNLFPYFVMINNVVISNLDIHTFVLLEMYFQGMFLEVELLGQKVNAYVDYQMLPNSSL